MAFNRPSYPTLAERSTAEIEARLPEARPRLRRSLLGVLGRVVAGLAHGLHGHLAWIADQLLPDTADDIDRHANIWGLERRSAAAAEGMVIFSGEDGAEIPAGTPMEADDGVAFETAESAAIVDGAADVAVVAVDAGVAGNREAGTTLSLTTAIAGVDSQADVGEDGLTGGADAEGDDDLRERVLARIRQPPHGGAEHDYAAWATQVPGVLVSGVWIRPLWMGAGTVGVLFIMDDEDNPIPTDTDVERVEDEIAAERPVTAEVYVVKPTPVTFDLTIELSPDTSAAREAVEAEIRDMIRRTREPGVTIKRTQIHRAIALASGVEDYDIQAPADDVTHEAHEIPVFGAITWQT